MDPLISPSPQTPVRTQIVREAQRLVTRTGFDRPGNCLHTADAAVKASRRHNIRLELRAGSCYWPMVPNPGPGVKDALFGYLWLGGRHPDVRRALREDRMPELHVWAVEVATGSVVDLSTGLFPAHARTLHLGHWTGDAPPAWVWAPVDELPTGVAYEEDPEALIVARRFLRS